MQQAWEWYGKIEPVAKPKDDMLPPIIYNKEQEQPKPKPIPHEEVAPIPEPQPQPKPIAPIRENDGDYHIASFQFYGTNGDVRLPKGFNFKIKKKNEKGYAKAWEELSSEEYDNLIRDCLVLRM